MDAPLHHRNRCRRLAVASAALALFSLAACAAPTASNTDAAPPFASDAHGVEAGHAAEMSSPARALIVADAGGEVTLLDLETEERSVIADARTGVESVQSDGRLVYIARRDGEETRVDVVDTARWTVPHGDHTHSFRGESRLIGTIEGVGPMRVTADAQRATVRFADGELALLVHDDLDKLDNAGRTSIDTAAAGPVVPFAGHLLAPSMDAALGGFTFTGDPLPEVTAPCIDPIDADVTRVGAVFACAEGAVLFTREVGGALAVESIALPGGASAPTALAGRPDRPDLAGVAGDQGVWLLDVRQREWTLLPSDVPFLRATAIGDDDSRTVAIDADGRIRVLAADGTVIARTEPLLAASVADPSLRDRVQLVVDATHAYVTDPATGTVHEIEHDDVAVTRTFEDLDPWFLQQVG